MMLIDVDYFKQVNDTYGHPTGDDILCKIASALDQNFRQGDIGIRYGGDEFMLILPGAGLPQAQAGADRFRNAVCKSCALPNGSCVTLSIGITQWTAEDNLKSFIARADEALYQAKKDGKNRVVTVK